MSVTNIPDVENKDQFFKEMGDKLLRFIRVRIGYTPYEKDICQNALIAIWEANQRGTIKNPDNPLPFAFGVCANKIKDYEREISRKRERQSDDLDTKPNDNVENALNGLLKNEERKVINLVISSLSKIEQDVIYLRYFERHSYNEIGRLLGISNENARQIARRARMKIADRLAMNF